ncbi:U3 small nucleolar RNA-associated protein [Drechslerella dactyloides]|uniref:U3 small nucleolar RNA-associated protein 25 n=1 Tax=Drechslerella dactyloides TaxID=74499 RepID=A0AAD6NP40_DREDA|nr:U3 small nucleolar RNA-associated protein [Drechslerella dactyloides]
MAFSALMNSFDLDKSSVVKHPSESHSGSALSRKRRKIDKNSPALTSDPNVEALESQSVDEPARSFIGKSTDALDSYERHFNIDNQPAELSATSTTLVHPVLGRITVSDTSHLQNLQVDSSDNALIGAINVERRSISQKSATEISDTAAVKTSQYIKIGKWESSEFGLLSRSSSSCDLVLKNNEKIAKRASNLGEITEKRDQGFTRPKVLFILPTRNSCHEVVSIISRHAARESQENKTRFDKEFGPSGLDKPFSDSKPEDFRSFFHGNSDDMFRIGIKLTRKTVKLFSSFYNSDIIIASPLGLKAAMGGTDKAPKDIDFLSSIEVVYVERADALLMQNWDHVESVFANLNRIPTDSHECDFSRVRNWYLDGNASNFRHTVISTAFLSPEVNALQSKYFRNHSGFVKFHDICPGQLSTHIPQVFTRVPSSSPAGDPDARFNHFNTVILPYWRDNVKTGESVGEISEYSSASAVARARAHFKSGRHKILLYTERAHHFRRYSIQGTLHIYLYSIPANPIFYGELVEFLRDSIANGKITLEDAKAQAIFTRWDALRAERIVGTIGYDEIKTSDGNKCVDFEFP